MNGDYRSRLLVLNAVQYRIVFWVQALQDLPGPVVSWQPSARAVVAASLRTCSPGWHDPLNALLCKDVKWQWGEKEQASFDKLRLALMNAPILAQTDWSKPFLLQTYASDVGLAGILAQEREKGVEVVIGYISQTLAPSEANWPVHEREALAIVWACGQFRPYIAHNPFTLIVQTDLRWWRSHR